LKHKPIQHRRETAEQIWFAYQTRPVRIAPASEHFDLYVHPCEVASLSPGNEGDPKLIEAIH
jgi:hypothetical protein